MTVARSLTVEVPYPPTVNRYWRRVGHRTVVSAEGRAYRRAVLDQVGEQLGGRGPAFADRLAVSLVVVPPDRRRRDLDNVEKALWDALQAAGVYRDDEQIDEKHVYRRAFGTAPPGCLVTVTTIGEPTP